MEEIESILNSFTEALILLDDDGNVVFLNDSATSTLGHFMEGKDAPHISDIIPENLKGITTLMIENVKSRKIPQTIDIDTTTAAGQPMQLEVTYSPVINSTDGVQRISVIARNITTQKTYEKKASQLIHEFTTLIENANAIIFGLDARGYITHWNRECEKITGYAKDEILAQKPHTFLHPEFTEAFNELKQRVFSSVSIENFDVRIRTKNNEDVTLLLNATPKFNINGQIVGCLMVGQDISELYAYRLDLEAQVKDRTQRLREALEKEKQLAEIKTKFISMASHEFKIPLHSINADVIQLLKNISDENHLQRLQNIQLKVTQMRGVLEDVLSIGKGEVKRIEPSISRIDLYVFLLNLSDEVITATGYTHKILIKGSEGFFLVDSDEKLLRNLFINLLSNAVKFSPGKAIVEVSLYDAESYVNIHVRDFGIGISKDDLTKVFDTFTRGSNIGSIQGSGLGLSIVRKATDALGATIEVESEIDKGTLFKVTMKKKIK